MIKLDAKINDICWDSLAKKILVGLDNGFMYMIDRPKKASIDNTETYLVTLPMKQWKIKMMDF